MPTLLEKIEEDAARRLPLPPDRQPAQELARYKNFLKVEGHRLKILHRAGAGGREICQARAAVMDVLLRYLVQAVQARIPPDKNSSNWALVAIGGYGRGELNPHSDIDFMFLHDGSLVWRGIPGPYLKGLTDGVLYPLWDIGLKVGHSTRSIADCINVANANMQSKTSLIEARLIASNANLLKGMQQIVWEKCVKGFEDAYIVARLEDQEERRAKFGNSACMQEPNIKNGCGGLRDYQNLLWMIFFKYRIRSLTELEAREQISATERKQLETAYDFLLRVRNELHYQVDRSMDVLPKSLQPSVAYNLGYVDRSPVRRLEKFMRDFYTHTRHIYLITRTLEQRLALMKKSKRLPSFRELIRNTRQTEQSIDGFKVLQGEIHAQSSRIFREQPRRLMRLFLYAQQRGLKLHPDLSQLLRQQLALVDRAFLNDFHIHETFLEILNQRGNVAPVLRAMHEVGFLGKYLPEFGRLTCLVQHEFYHQYTTDEHTLVCLQKLDQIWDAEEPPFQHYEKIFRELERPFVLYLALLLHDAGKGKAHPNKVHAEVGGKLALNVARRLGLDDHTTETLRLVIENHLLLVQISQRRDLEDPTVIRTLAQKLKTPENLVLLTLHTFADSQGTSDNLWNDFKETLLWTLFQKTMAVFLGGPDFLRAEEKQRELLGREIRELAPRTISDEEIHAHFANLPPRYLQIHTAKEIFSDLALAHRFMHLQMADDANGLAPIFNWHNEPDRGYTAVKVCTWNRAGLFNKIAGSLTAAGLNILTAQIFSRNDGIILDTFFVNDALTGKLVNREEREKFEHLLLAALTGQVDFPSLIARLKLNRSLYQSLEGERIPTSIHLDNSVSETRTVMDIVAEDRVGLLFVISQTLAELRLDISVAKISTERGAAIDSFYISELDGSKILSPDRLNEIEESLRTAISSLLNA